MDLTILMPCLNEEKTIEKCIYKAQEFIKKYNINGEIVIADNGSTDASTKIAESLGVRVVHVKEKGYGSALIKGMKESKGEFVIIGDADDSYNFLEINPIFEKLKEGYELVVGNRYLGKMEKGAMKLSHKYIGTPIISYMGRKKYNLNIGDFNCGLRGYKKDVIEKLDCTALRNGICK